MDRGHKSVAIVDESILAAPRAPLKALPAILSEEKLLRQGMSTAEDSTRHRRKCRHFHTEQYRLHHILTSLPTVLQPPTSKIFTTIFINSNN